MYIIIPLNLHFFIYFMQIKLIFLFHFIIKNSILQLFLVLILLNCFQYVITRIIDRILFLIS